MSEDFHEDAAIRSLLRYFKRVGQRNEAAIRLGFTRVIFRDNTVDDTRLIADAIRKIPRVKGHRVINGGDMDPYNGSPNRWRVNVFFENADDALLFKLKYNGDLV